MSSFPVGKIVHWTEDLASADSDVGIIRTRIGKIIEVRWGDRQDDGFPRYSFQGPDFQCLVEREDKVRSWLPQKWLEAMGNTNETVIR